MTGLGDSIGNSLGGGGTGRTPPWKFGAGAPAMMEHA